MDGRGHLPPLLLGGRASGSLPVDARGRALLGTPLHVLTPVALLEQKVATQHVEIQRFLSENQSLATTHVAVRQELVATQQEMRRVLQAFIILKNEKDEQMKALFENIAKLETDLRATESLKAELENAKAGAHKLLAVKQDLSGQITQLTQELNRTKTEMPQVPMKAKMEALQQEVLRARNAYEYEKKANTELLEQRGAMEKNLVSMAREVEKLHAELKARAGAFGVPFDTSDARYPSVAAFGNAYNLSQMPPATKNEIPFGSGSTATWGAYDLHHASGLRR